MFQLLNTLKEKLRCDECRNWKPVFKYGQTPEDIAVAKSECDRGVTQHERGVEPGFCCAFFDPCF